MLLDQYEGKHVEIKVIGKRPNNRPYVRIGFVEGEYIASESNSVALRCLAHQILRALGDRDDEKVVRMRRE